MSKPTALIYMRVSSKAQSEKDSIERQRKLLPPHAEKNGWRVIGTFEDDGISGKLLAERKGFVGLLAALAEQRPDFLLCLSPDRMGRPDPGDLDGLIALAQTARRNDVTIQCLSGITVRPNNDDFTRWINVLNRAGRENAEKGVGVQQGKLWRLVTGQWAFGRRIYGYRVTADRTGFDVVPAEAEVIQRIYEMIGVRHLSQREVAKALREEKVPTPRASQEGKFRKGRPSSRWCQAMIRGILSQPAYVTGQITYDIRAMFNRYVAKCKALDMEPGLTEAELPDDGLVRWKVKPLVNQRTYDAAQALVASRVTKTGRPRKDERDERFLFGQHLYCHLCGHKLARKLQREGRGRPTYRCPLHTDSETHRDGAAKCGLPVLDAGKVDEALWKQLLGYVTTPDEIVARWMGQDAADPADLDRLRAEVARADKAIAGKDRARQNVLALVRDGVFSAAEARAATKELDADLVGLRQAHATAKATLDAAEATAGKRAEARTLATHWRKILGRIKEGAALRKKLDGLPFAKRRDFLRRMLGGGRIELVQVTAAEIAQQAADGDGAFELRQEWLDKDVMVAAMDVPLAPATILAALASVEVIARSVAEKSMGAC